MIHRKHVGRTRRQGPVRLLAQVWHHRCCALTERVHTMMRYFRSSTDMSSSISSSVNVVWSRVRTWTVMLRAAAPTSASAASAAAVEPATVADSPETAASAPAGGTYRSDIVPACRAPFGALTAARSRRRRRRALFAIANFVPASAATTDPPCVTASVTGSAGRARGPWTRKLAVCPAATTWN